MRKHKFIAQQFHLPKANFIEKVQCIALDFSGGGGWIRTTEAEKQQIYSLPPLATRELLRITFLLKQKIGAGGRTRTPDLLITNQLLYQLSYTSLSKCYHFVLCRISQRLNYYITPFSFCQALF